MINDSTRQKKGVNATFYLQPAVSCNHYLSAITMAIALPTTITQAEQVTANEAKIQQLLQKIQAVNIVDQLSVEAIEFAADEFRISFGAMAGKLSELRACSVPAIITRSVRVSAGAPGFSQTFAFVRPGGMHERLLKGVIDELQLTSPERGELIEALKKSIFNGKACAILLPSEQVEPPSPLRRSAEWAVRDGIILHELKHYQQYLDGQLSGGKSPEQMNTIEEEAFQFQMLYLARRGLSFENVIASFCDVAGLSSEEAKQRHILFAESFTRRRLVKVWNERVKPALQRNSINVPPQ